MSDDLTLPPEMLPRCPGAEVYVQCVSCDTYWATDQHDKCPKCGFGPETVIQ